MYSDKLNLMYIEMSQMLVMRYLLSNQLLKCGVYKYIIPLYDN